MRKRIAAANWKMNLLPGQVAEYFQAFSMADRIEGEIVFFPMAISTHALISATAGRNLKWGAQNFYFEESGAFTGEISGKAFVDLGATYLLVGHSERRSIFAESDELVAKKVAAAQAWGVEPMICVGESLEQRLAGETDRVISEQLKHALSGGRLDLPFCIAYEPVWAIGTGQVATPEQANAAHKVLRMTLAELGGSSLGDKVSILYGGSVKPTNAVELISCDEIDGFLVGGASLDPMSFGQICKAIS